MRILLKIYNVFSKTIEAKHPPFGSAWLLLFNVPDK